MGPEPRMALNAPVTEAFLGEQCLGIFLHCGARLRRLFVYIKAAEQSWTSSPCSTSLVQYRVCYRKPSTRISAHHLPRLKRTRPFRIYPTRRRSNISRRSRLCSACHARYAAPLAANPPRAKLRRRSPPPTLYSTTRRKYQLQFEKHGYDEEIDGHLTDA